MFCKNIFGSPARGLENVVPGDNLLVHNYFQTILPFFGIVRPNRLHTMELNMYVPRELSVFCQNLFDFFA